jgi:predicted nuclease of restriction endonuclease-like RecB superfamily
LHEKAIYYGTKRCKSCVRSLGNKINNPSKNPEIMKKIVANRRSYKGKNNPMYGKPAPKGSGIGKGQYYKNIWLRSSYEVIYAKQLDKTGIKWLYEFKRFNLGDTTYIPDFYLPDLDMYIEVKGWWRPTAILKFKLFQKLYPKIKIRVITKKDLK